MSKLGFIEIDFCNMNDPEDFVTLKWEIKSNIGAGFWLKYLKKSIMEKIEMNSRFYGFTSGDRDWEFLGKKINKCIEIINNDQIDYNIEEKFTGSFDQNFSNRIHHHFEVLIGPDWDKTEVFRNASPIVQDAICGLNVFIHEMEALNRAEQTDFEHRFHSAFAVFEWKKGMIIPDICDSEFTLNFKWGDIVLNYAQIGKTWLEVYLDNDEEIFPEAIIPLRQITGSFDIFWGEISDVDSCYKGIDEILLNFGKNINDKSQRIGYLPVASLVMPDQLSREQLINNISPRNRMRGLRYIKNGTVDFETVFNRPSDPINV